MILIFLTPICDTTFVEIFSRDAKNADVRELRGGVQEKKLKLAIGVLSDG